MSSPLASSFAARSSSAMRIASLVSCKSWISGTTARLSIQCMKDCTRVSMMASACATAAWRFSTPVCTTAPRSSTVYRKTSSRRADFGFDIARHRQIDHEHRLVAARLDRAFDQAQADDRQRRRGAGHDDVELRQLLRQVGQADRAAVEAVRQRFAAFQRAVGDGQRFRILRGEMGRAQFDHFAGADEQHVLLGDRVEDALRQAHRGGGHRHAVRADFGGAAHFLGDREGALEHLVQIGAEPPAASAWRTASFIWPRICGSPSTIESSPEATRNAWRTALSCGSVYR